MTETEFFNMHHKRTFVFNHPYASKLGFVYNHRLKVEKVIGRHLKPGEEVHHHYNWDGSATLVLCESIAYHNLLHSRELALRMCGNVNWRKCKFCKQYDDPKNLRDTWSGIYHRLCSTKYQKERRQYIGSEYHRERRYNVIGRDRF